ncbi:hypothetical protein XENOCAPTIV_000966, partial [Xenoophorus captivus]
GLCSLTIDKALPEDEGQYKCRAENSAGRAECFCMVLVDGASETTVHSMYLSAVPDTLRSKPVQLNPGSNGLFWTLNVLQKFLKSFKLLLMTLPPQILQFPEDMKILAGEKVEILCKFSGAPPITCTWLKFRKPNKTCCFRLRGKFGQVFKLVEKATKKVWAGKFIKAYSAKEKENVRQEINIMNSLHHPKLVQCVDAFEGKSDIVMVLEM